MSHTKTPAHHKTVFLFPIWTESTGHRCQAGEGLLWEATSPSLASSPHCCPGTQRPPLALVPVRRAPACWPRSAFHLRLPKAQASGSQTKTSPVTFNPETSFLCKSETLHFRNIPGLISEKELAFVISVLWLQEDREQHLTVLLHNNSGFFVMLSNSFILTSSNMEKFQSSSTKRFQWTCRCDMTNGICWGHRHLFGDAIFVKQTRASPNNLYC